MKMAVSKISGRPEEYFLKRENRVFLASEIIFKNLLEIIWANLVTFSCSLGEEVQKLRFSEIWCELINYATNRKSYKILKKGDFRRAIWQGSAAFTPKFRLDLTERHLMIHKYESGVWHIKQVSFVLFCYLLYDFSRQIAKKNKRYLFDMPNVCFVFMNHQMCLCKIQSEFWCKSGRALPNCSPKIAFFQILYDFRFVA